MALGVGLIGAGIFALEGQGPAWKAMVDAGRVRIAACWSRSEESASRLAQFYAGAPDIYFGQDDAVAEMLRRTDIDAVSVTTPIADLPKYAQMAMDAGKHVLTEKPIAGSLESGAAILKYYESLACSERPVFYGVAENFRFERVYTEAAQMLASGILGTLFTIELTAHMPFAPDSKYEKTQWRRSSDHIGGVITDGGVHFMAALRLLAGCEVASCAAMCDRKSQHLPKVDTVTATLRFESGLLGSAALCYAAGSRYLEIRIRGATGLMVIRRGQENGTHGYHLTVSGGEGAEETSFYAFCGVDGEIAGFVDVCLGEGDTKELKSRLDPRQSLRDLAIVDAMLRSSDEALVVRPNHLSSLKP